MGRWKGREGKGRKERKGKEIYVREQGCGAKSAVVVSPRVACELDWSGETHVKRGLISWGQQRGKWRQTRKKTRPEGGNEMGQPSSQSWRIKTAMNWVSGLDSGC